MEGEQRRGFQFVNKDIEFGYPQPVPTLSPYVPTSYYQKQGYKTPLLNDTNQSMMDQYYQNCIINTNMDNQLEKSSMQGLSQEQFDELKKSILEKKEQADNEVNKSEGFFF